LKSNHNKSLSGFACAAFPGTNRFVTAHTRRRGTRKTARLTNTTRKGIDTKCKLERGARSLYFRDPDGHLIEVATRNLGTNLNRRSFATTRLHRLSRSALHSGKQINADKPITWYDDRALPAQKAGWRRIGQPDLCVWHMNK
jgi:hypothetical protein